MLSLKSGKPIAIIDGDKAQKIYIKESAEDEPSELETTQENKVKIFKEHIKLDPKLSQKEINQMVNAYQAGALEIEGRNDRKYDDALTYTANSLKKYLRYPTTTKLFPIIEDKTWRIYISGSTGSGKSVWCKNFIKLNRKKGQEVFLFSPFEDDESLRGIKDMITVNFEEFAHETGHNFEYEDIPENAICLFDDIDSSKDKQMVKYLETLRDKCLQIGRHKGICVCTISHNPMEGNKTKSSIREAGYFVTFPQFNLRDTTALLKTYAGYTQPMIDEVLNNKSRWTMICKQVPLYWVSEHGVKLNN